MKELFLRTLTGISLIILVLGAILLGSAPFLGILIVVYTLSILELFSVFRQERMLPSLVMAVSSGLLLPVAFAIVQLHWSPLWFILPAAGWIPGYIRSRCSSIGLLILLWLAIPFTSFYLLGWADGTGQYHFLIPLSVIALVWIFDTFAYIVGSLLGRHKMTPRLSPSKTWEGFVGGLIFTVLAGWIVFKLAGKFSAGLWLCCSLIVVILGLTGDLFESGLKRQKQVKNMGSLLPGHGGVLDRFDSLLFVAPVLLLFFYLLNLYL